jgi:hypothetical protein
MTQKSVPIYNSDKHGRFNVFWFQQGCNNDSILQEYDAASKNNRIQSFRGNGFLKLELDNLLIKFVISKGEVFTTLLKIKVAANTG